MLTLNINEDLEVEFALTQKDATTGADEVATGLSSIFMHILSGPESASLTNVAASERGATGVYYGYIPTATLVSVLTAYIGKVVYLTTARTNTFFRVEIPAIVTDNRSV
jgi:Flp pilus assembly pilin Flp